MESLQQQGHRDLLAEVHVLREDVALVLETLLLNLPLEPPLKVSEVRDWVSSNLRRRPQD